MNELKSKLNEKIFIGYNKETQEYYTEILKEDLMNFIENEFCISNLKII